MRPPPPPTPPTTPPCCPTRPRHPSPPAQHRPDGPLPTNSLHASNRTLHESAPPIYGGFPGPPKRPATPWGPPHGLAVQPPRLPSPRGPADHQRRVAWADWAPRRGSLSDLRTLRRPRPHTAVTGRGHASPVPPRPHHHRHSRPRHPGPVGSNLDSASRTSLTRAGASLPSDRSKPARSSLTIAAPCGRRHGSSAPQMTCGTSGPTKIMRMS